MELSLTVERPVGGLRGPGERERERERERESERGESIPNVRHAPLVLESYLEL